jgi:hypothetical protein
MTTLEKQIQKARPLLKTVTPLAYWIITIYAYFNILLGISLFLAVDQSKITASLLIVNDIFSYKFWGIVFMAIGVLKLVALHTNNWKLSRQSLLVGVAIKAAWALALVVRSLTSPGTWLVSIIWIALAAIQIVTFIFFMPPSMATNKQSRRGEDDE